MGENLVYLAAGAGLTWFGMWVGWRLANLQSPIPQIPKAEKETEAEEPAASVKPIPFLAHTSEE